MSEPKLSVIIPLFNAEKFRADVVYAEKFLAFNNTCESNFKLE